MCLMVDKKRKKPTKKMTVYKVLLKDGSRIITPSEYVEVKEGLFKANRSSASPTCAKLKSGTSVYGGAIHVYEDRKEAHDVWCKNDKDRFVLECTAEAKDFIAWGSSGDICFTQITIPVGSLKDIGRKEKVKVLSKEIDDLLSVSRTTSSRLYSLKKELATL